MPRRTHSWLPRLLGLPLLALGLIALAAMVREVMLVTETYDWVQAQATVEEVKLLTRTTSKGASSYRVMPRYTYVVHGKTFEGKSIREGDWERGLDSGSYHEEWHTRLNAAKQAGHRVDVWYAPDDPQRSVLSREFRSVILVTYAALMLIFGGIGGYLVFAPARAPKPPAKASAARQPEPKPATLAGYPSAGQALDDAVDLKIEESAGQTHVHFLRKNNGAVLLAVAGMIFLSSGFFSTRVMVIPFSILGLCLIAGAFWMWNQITSWRIADGRLEVRRRVGNRTIALTEITAIQEHESFTAKADRLYGFVAMLKGGKQRHLIAGIREKDLRRLRQVIARYKPR